MKSVLSAKLIFPGAVIIYVFAAIAGSGFLHADEHYQIIEFAWSKFQAYGEKDYAWEFEAASRSAIQPMMAWISFSILKLAGVAEPFFLAFALRFITAITALFVIRNFVKSSKHLISENALPYYELLSYFIWFLPLINVRFSSEVWAGIALLHATSIILKSDLHTQRSVFLTGVFIGFSFLFRFQMGSVVIGIFLWLLLVKKTGLQKIGMYLLGFGLIFMTGILIDRWLYGKFVLSAWNYFDLQILQSVAAGFGETPWWEYFRIIIFAPGWPIGLLLLISAVWFLISSPKSVISWIIISFMLLHFFVGHKEERFLFPLANFSALIIFVFVSILYSSNFIRKWNRKVVFLVAGIPLILVNLIGLTAILDKSAGSGSAEIGEYIKEKYPEKPVKLLHTPYSCFYSPFDSAPVKFYERANVRHQKIENLCSLSDSLMNVKDSIVLFSMRMNEHGNPECEQRLKAFGLKKVAQGMPDWILELNRNYYHQIDTNGIIELYSR